MDEQSTYSLPERSSSREGHNLPSLEDYLSGRRKTLGWGILEWCSTYLGQPDRDDKGEPWQFTNEQALFILRFYEVNEFGMFSYRRAVLERPKGWGKAIRNGQSIPTPAGWVKHGDLQIGDLVYGRHGQPVRVLKVHEPVHEGFYDVTFSDGTTIVAHAQHEWVMQEFTGKGWSEVLIETQEMLRQGLAKWRLPNTPAVEGVQQDRTVQSIVPASGHSGNCITVEGGIYLVGETYIPTHNSPLLASICSAEFLGPTRFSHWEAGEPVGKPVASPLVQVCGISEDQADATMSLIVEMFLEGEASNAYPALQVMMSKVVLPHHGKIQRVTASPRGREGQRATFYVSDETHLWVPANQGDELMATLRRNVAKSGSRSIETTNAHVPGEGSVAEDSYQAFLKMQSGETYDEGLLFDTKEAAVSDIYDWEQAYPALLYVYGDSAKEGGGWVDLKNHIFPEVCDPGSKEHTSRRFFFNEKTETSSTWLKLAEWNGCYDKDIALRRDEVFALGFKGAIRNGAASIVACRLEDNALFLLGMWSKPDKGAPDWEVPYQEVVDRLEGLLERDECCKLVADPEHWQEIIGRLSAKHENKVEEFWLTKSPLKAVKATEQFETAVRQGRIKWRDPQLSQHIQHCHTSEVPQGTLIRKDSPHSKRYISAAQASILALEASVLSIEEGALNTGGSVWSF